MSRAQYFTLPFNILHVSSFNKFHKLLHAFSKPLPILSSQPKLFVVRGNKEKKNSVIPRCTVRKRKNLLNPGLLSLPLYLDSASVEGFVFKPEHDFGRIICEQPP